MWATLITKWKDWFQSSEDYFLSNSVDLADFERRQRLLERNRSKSFVTQIW